MCRLACQRSVPHRKEVNCLDERYDVIVTPSFGGRQLQDPNFDCHPALWPSKWDSMLKAAQLPITFTGEFYLSEDKLDSSGDYLQA